MPNVSETKQLGVMILVNNQLDVQFVQVTVWYTGNMHTRRSPAQSDISQVSH